MAKFRKKPVVVEAFQMTEERRWDNSEWPNWLHLAWNMEIGEVGALWCDIDPPHTFLHISTLDDQHYPPSERGVQNVNFDDWIIQGVAGEIYPCKPDIFEQTYEPVEAPDGDAAE